ncbi:MAG: nuclear transport factor 2 family protein [Pseudomonadota bacterium]
MYPVASLFVRYFDAFEAAVSSDQWEEVGDCFAEDCRYRVLGVPFACDLHGRAAVMDGFRRSLDGFDRRVDGRLLDLTALTRLGADQLSVQLVSGYDRAGAPSLRLPVTMYAEFEQDRLVLLEDRYEPRWLGGALAWLETYGADLDPRYRHNEQLA